MNMLPPLNVKAFNSMHSKIANAYLDIPKLSMSEAAKLYVSIVSMRTVRLKT